MDGFGVALPRLGVKGGEDFEFELGAPLRLRLYDQEPLQRAQDYGRLRRQDWDERSDFAQVVRHLRIGRRGEPRHGPRHHERHPSRVRRGRPYGGTE